MILATINVFIRKGKGLVTLLPVLFKLKQKHFRDDASFQQTINFSNHSDRYFLALKKEKSYKQEISCTFIYYFKCIPRMYVVTPHHPECEFKVPSQILRKIQSSTVLSVQTWQGARIPHKTTSQEVYSTHYSSGDKNPVIQAFQDKRQDPSASMKPTTCQKFL